MVSTETEFAAAAPGRAPSHRGDPEAGAGAVAVRGGPVPYPK